MPFVLWLVFSVVYYGYPFPNTYYAKLYTGIGAAQLIKQGLLYYVDSMAHDPVTLIVILSALVLTALGRNKKHLVVGLGVLLYLAYILKIGGDFMSGRFFAAPFFVSIILLVTQSLPFKIGGRLLPAILVLVVGLFGPKPSAFTGTAYGGAGGEGAIRDTGICNERAFYFQQSGLVNAGLNSTLPPITWDSARVTVAADPDSVVVKQAVGYYGFSARQSKYVIDQMALADPLLSRLPVPDRHHWRIGHFARVLPPGYKISRKTGQNNIPHPSLAPVFDDVLLIARGPLLSGERWKAIWRMNLHLNDSLIYDYSRSPSFVKYEQINSPRTAGTAWNAQGTIFVKRTGLDIGLGKVCFDSLLEISLDYNDSYLVRLRKNANVSCSLSVGPSPDSNPGLRVDTLAIPPSCRETGYNTISVIALSGDGRYSIGHVRFIRAGIPPAHRRD
jgi:arabinofuranosyltransferase